jgi:hypothetical protein
MKIKTYRDFSDFSQIVKGKLARLAQVVTVFFVRSGFSTPCRRPIYMLVSVKTYFVENRTFGMQQQDQSVPIETPEDAESISEQSPTGDENEQATNAPEDTGGETLRDDRGGQAGDTWGGAGTAADVAQPRASFDWPALVAALAIAAFFALTARFNSQPSPSYIPAAVFSATGCGLLVMAVRKLRRKAGVGLREAGLAGFGMALFQFAITFTYPSVYTTVTTAPEYGRAFLITWGLVALFATLLSLAGAAIGYLAFAPPRPLPKRITEPDADNEEESEEVETEQSTTIASTAEKEEANPEQESGQGEAAEQNEEAEQEEQEVTAPPNEVELPAQPQRSLVSYAITILLLGLLPMMIGYVFAAVYDFVMQAINVDQISPALYPTLSLLGGLLPWRLAAPINLSSINGSFIVFTLLWRIPDSVLGNPNLFDVQTLEPFVFNAAGLAILLITMYGSQNRRQAAPWGTFLLLQALLGLILILPANLWMLRGLEGVLQLGNQVVQLPTFHLLNPTLFLLNSLTGTLFCVLVGLIVRRQYQLWTIPRSAPEEKEAA